MRAPNQAGAPGGSGMAEFGLVGLDHFDFQLGFAPHCALFLAAFFCPDHVCGCVRIAAHYLQATHGCCVYASPACGSS